MTWCWGRFYIKQLFHKKHISCPRFSTGNWRVLTPQCAFSNRLHVYIPVDLELLAAQWPSFSRRGSCPSHSQRPWVLTAKILVGKWEMSLWIASRGGRHWTWITISTVSHYSIVLKGGDKTRFYTYPSFLLRKKGNKKRKRKKKKKQDQLCPLEKKLQHPACKNSSV